MELESQTQRFTSVSAHEVRYIDTTSPMMTEGADTIRYLYTEPKIHACTVWNRIVRTWNVSYGLVQFSPQSGGSLCGRAPHDASRPLWDSCHDICSI